MRNLLSYTLLAVFLIFLPHSAEAQLCTCLPPRAGFNIDEDKTLIFEGIPSKISLAEDDKYNAIRHYTPVRILLKPSSYKLTNNEVLVREPISKNHCAPEIAIGNVQRIYAKKFKDGTYYTSSCLQEKARYFDMRVLNATCKKESNFRQCLEEVNQRESCMSDIRNAYKNARLPFKFELSNRKCSFFLNEYNRRYRLNPKTTESE